MATSLTSARRLRAAAIDLLVVLPWLAFAGGLGAILWSIDAQPTSPQAQDALAFASLVAPVIVSFAWLESGERGGAPGQRHEQLEVLDHRGQRPGFVRALARNALKFLPWQLGHSGVFWLLADAEQTFALGLAVLAQLLVAANLVALVVSHGTHAVHDRLTGTTLRVRRR